MPTSHPQENRIIRLEELKRLLGGVSTASIYRWQARGILTQSVRIGVRGVGWRLSEIEQLIRDGFPTGGRHE